MVGGRRAVRLGWRAFCMVLSSMTTHLWRNSAGLPITVCTVVCKPLTGVSKKQFCGANNECSYRFLRVFVFILFSHQPLELFLLKVRLLLLCAVGMNHGGTEL